jgi:hypothetical protein
MVSRRALIWTVFLFALFTLIAPVRSAPLHAQNPCDGLVTPRLTTGGAARVIASYGLSLKDRAATGAAGSTEVAQMPYGTVVGVSDGPTCNFGFVWWQLQLPNGTVGWAAEGGSGADYYLEPYTVGLDMYKPGADASRLLHYFVNPDGFGQVMGQFTIRPQSGTPQTVWQQVEIDWLGQALDSVSQGCPDRLANSDLSGVTTLDAALQLPLPALEYDYYPSPDGNRLVLVRHQELRVPRCDNVVPERAGISTVSVLDASGVETVLFPFPQHGSIPESSDSYTDGEPSASNVALDEVVWSPQGRYIAFVASYRYACNRQDCYRFHIYVSNLDTGQLYILGEGRHVGWSSGGERINFFRWVTGTDGKQTAHLYSARPDGTDRQEVWLPGGAGYVSPERQPLGFPWDDSGTHVMVGNAGVGEVMLFDVADRSFSTPVFLPDLMPQPNRLSVHFIHGEKTYFWTTIRGEFVLQNARTGDWTQLNSTVATTGVAPTQARPFALGDKALIEMADGSAYILDMAADQLSPVMFGG